MLKFYETGSISISVIWQFKISLLNLSAGFNGPSDLDLPDYLRIEQTIELSKFQKACKPKFVCSIGDLKTQWGEVALNSGSIHAYELTEPAVPGSIPCVCEGRRFIH